MEGFGERDSTKDWLLGEGAAPPLVGELVERIEEALAVARAAERAALAVGDAAIDASENAKSAVAQAKRAAEQAQRSARMAEQASLALAGGGTPSPARAGQAAPPGDDGRLRSFSERADRVVARLRALESLPA